MELHTHIFFKKKPVERCEARVVRVKANGVVVFVPKFGIEAPLVFDSAADSGGSTEEEWPILRVWSAARRRELSTLESPLDRPSKLTLIIRLTVTP